MRILNHDFFFHFHKNCVFNYADYKTVKILTLPFFSIATLYDFEELYPKSDWSKYL